MLSFRVLLHEDEVTRCTSRCRGGRKMGNGEGCSSGDIKVSACQGGKGNVSSLLPSALAWTHCHTRTRHFLSFFDIQTSTTVLIKKKPIIRRLLEYGLKRHLHPLLAPVALSESIYFRALAAVGVFIACGFLRAENSGNRRQSPLRSRAQPWHLYSMSLHI